MFKDAHVCILTTAHPMDDVRVYRKFAETFVKSGFRVTWVGPEYCYGKSGDLGDVEIAYELVKPARSRLGRFAMPRRVKARAKCVEGVDVFYAPDPDVVRCALSLAEEHDARVICDIHELYLDVHLRKWVPGWGYNSARSAMTHVLRRLYAKSDLVIGVSESVVAPFRSALKDCVIVRNCAPSWFALCTSGCGQAKRWNGGVVMHGKGTVYNGTPIVLEAIRLARPESPSMRVIMFRSDETDREIGRHEKAHRFDDIVRKACDVRDYVSMSEMPAILSACDIGMIGHGRQLAEGTQPNRLYEYMASGLAVLAPEYDKGIAPIVEKEQCGMLVDFEDPSSIAGGLRYLCNNPDICMAMGENGRAAFLARHNWESEVRPVVDRIKSWCGVEADEQNVGNY